MDAGEAGVQVGSSPADPIRLFWIEDWIRDEAAISRLLDESTIQIEQSVRNDSEPHQTSLDTEITNEPSR